MARRRVGRTARSRQLAGTIPAPNATLAGVNGQPTTDRGAAQAAVETEALSVTHWFDSEPDGEPNAATIRFTGRRIAIRLLVTCFVLLWIQWSGAA